MIKACSDFAKLAFFLQMGYNSMRLSNRSKGELLFLFKKMSLSCRARGTAVGGGGIKNKTAPLAHKRSRKAVILFAKEEHRGSDQILSGIVGKVVQEQPNAAVKPATEIGVAENRVRNGKERGADGH